MVNPQIICTTVMHYICYVNYEFIYNTMLNFIYKTFTKKTLTNLHVWNISWKTSSSIECKVYNV